MDDFFALPGNGHVWVQWPHVFFSAVATAGFFFAGTYWMTDVHERLGFNPGVVPAGGNNETAKTRSSPRIRRASQGRPGLFVT